MFGHALKLDRGFARAHAGLSFTHFQNAFLGFTPDAAAERALARASATTALEHDPLDPFANLTMGRAEWLAGNLEASLPWMERSIALSPNYAFAIYNSALVGTLLGDGAGSEARIVQAMALSPLDPLGYAMLATRALTHLVRGDHAAAATWADRAVRAPNAHVQIFAIAAIANEATGQRGKAEAYVAHIRAAHPDYTRAQFLASFPFRDGDLRRQAEATLKALGL